MRRPFTVTNQTGRTWKYASLKEAADDLKISRERVRQLLQQGEHRGLTFAYTDEAVEPRQPQQYASQPVMFTKGDQVMTFPSIKQAADYFQVSVTSIQYAIKQGEWRGLFVTCPETYVPSTGQIEVPPRGKGGQQPISVLCQKDGKWMAFRSKQDAAEFFGVSSLVHLEDGCTWRGVNFYFDKKPYKPTGQTFDPPEPDKRNAARKPLAFVSGEETLEFPSMAAAARHFGVQPAAIAKTLRSMKPWRGYEVRRSVTKQTSETLHTDEQPADASLHQPEVHSELVLQ